MYALLLLFAPDATHEQIERLGHKRFKTREAASAYLSRTDDAATRWLVREVAVTHRDPEVRMRTTAIGNALDHARLRRHAPFPPLSALWYNTTTGLYETGYDGCYSPFGPLAALGPGPDETLMGRRYQFEPYLWGVGTASDDGYTRLQQREGTRLLIAEWIEGGVPDCVITPFLNAMRRLDAEAMTMPAHAGPRWKRFLPWRHLR